MIDTGNLRTRTMTDQDALTHLKFGLADESSGFIYHCLNHYFCPIGFEDTPMVIIIINIISHDMRSCA